MYVLDVVWYTYFDCSFCSLNDGVEWHVICLLYLYIQSHRDISINVIIHICNDGMIGQLDG